MSAPPPPRPLRILIVEDEALILMLLKDMISELGHLCAQSAARLEPALAAASAADYDLAILDVNLRGEETYPVAEIAATHRKPVIFATGYGEQGLPEAWRDRPILQKLFDADALKDAIAAAMRGSAS